MNLHANKGFTLIELIIVIAVLGILAAVALPKFADLTTEAQNAAFDGVFGGFSAAVNIVHAKWLVSGQGTQVSLDNGATIEVTPMGWPEIGTVTAQDTASELYALVMTGAVPAGWAPTESATDNAGEAYYNFTAKSDPKRVLYLATSGLVCQVNATITVCP